MNNNNNSNFENIIILCLVLGYIAIIIANIGNVYYETKTSQSTSSQTTDYFAEETRTSEEETLSEALKMVYIAPYGERYHYKSTCAGKNAVEATFDSASRVYSACQKCVH